MEIYDAVFIGGGPGGYVGAIRAAQRGARVAVIEGDELGGVCLNRGCIPTKALIASVEALRVARRLGEFGIRLDSEPVPDLAAMHERRKKIVTSLVRGIGVLFKSYRIKLIKGHGTLIAPDHVKVAGADGNVEIGAKNIVLATGSRPAIIPGLDPDGKKVLTSNDLLERDAIPERLLIIGAGAIGCEWACIYSGLGSKVTLVEMMDHLLPLEDEDISATLEREFKKQKISFKLGVKIAKLERGGSGIAAILESGDAVEADWALVSIGRACNTDNLGLENVGISPGKGGRIEVNEKMETLVAGIYAIGDIAAGGPMLAHVASAEGIVAAENITGGKRIMDFSAVPGCTFTHPEVASVGLKESDAKNKGIGYKVGLFDFRVLGKAQVMGQIAGKIKIVADDSGKILGVHMLGHSVSDLIHEGVIAVRYGLTADQLAEAIHAHPTMAEGLVEAAENVTGNAIHRL